MKKTIKSIYCSILFYLRNNAYALTTLLVVISPFVCLKIGRDSVNVSPTFFIVEIVVIAFLIIAIYFTRTMMKLNGLGDELPIPNKRFTNKVSDGEVNVNRDRLQEMILYLADVEDYIERKGLM